MILDILSSFRVGCCTGLFIELPSLSGLLRLNKTSRTFVLQAFRENMVRRSLSEVCKVRLLYGSWAAFRSGLGV